MTLVPLVLYFNHKGIAKLKIGVAKGKKTADKRETSAKRDWNRQKQRLLEAERRLCEVLGGPGPTHRGHLHATSASSSTFPARALRGSIPRHSPARRDHAMAQRSITTRRARIDDPRTLKVFSTDWLAAHLNDPDLRILDASYYLPARTRAATRWPNTRPLGISPVPRFFDIDEIRERLSTDCPQSTIPAVLDAHGRHGRYENIHEPHARHGCGRRAPGGGL
jgi:hypothetical protein